MKKIFNVFSKSSDQLQSLYENIETLLEAARDLYSRCEALHIPSPIEQIKDLNPVFISSAGQPRS